MFKTSPTADQAEKLRRIVENLRERTEIIIDRSAKKTKERARLITITSGKGGVGKTSLTINIAIQLVKYGYKVVIIDGDLGLANIEVMLGVVPKYNMYDIVSSELGLTDVMTDGPMGIKFISGGTGIMEMACLNRQNLEMLLNILSPLDNYADFILVDTGAGISRNVIEFVLAAKEVIIVTNSEPTSITDSYAMLKIISLHNKNCKPKLIANFVDSPEEAENTFNLINAAANRFINTEVINLGFLKKDPLVGKAIKLQVPFYISFPKSDASRSIERIAQRIMGNLNYQQRPGGLKDFISKLYESMKSS